MTGAWPQALLVEHPALPLPAATGRSGSERVLATDLEAGLRAAVALQLVAVTALLAEFELWPGRWALRRASVEITDDGPRVVLPALPVPLSPVWQRLGGGEGAAEATAAGALDAVAAVTGIDRERLSSGLPEPAGGLDRVIEHLLDELVLPLDRATARALWMLRWSMPPEPEPGDTLLYEVRDAGIAIRLGAAVWSAARRRRTAATLELARLGETVTKIAECPGDGALQIVVGELDSSTLASLVDRPGDRSSSLLVLGSLPHGWTAAPAPVFDGSRVANHVAVIGLSPAPRLRWLDHRNGRFDPFSGADRRWLTTSATRLFRDRRQRRAGCFDGLVSTAGLAPDGVPVDLALELADSDAESLRQAARERVVRIGDGLVMLPEPAPLRVDPRHGDVADLFAHDDPRHILHRSLAGGNPGPLLDWARQRLDDLDSWPVRDLLSAVAPGALGPGADIALAEACLGLADVHGARRVLDALDDEIARPWTSWLRLLDRSPGLEVELPRSIDLTPAARACAEVALVGVRRNLWRGRRQATEPLKMVHDASERLVGPLRRWVEIRLTALLEPERLDDAGWRREHAGGHPELVGLVLFERSVRATVCGDHRLAIGLLRRLIRAERSPGRRALMLVNLGTALAEQGRDRDAALATMSAYRLFQAAGFCNRIRDPLHNLAVADIDALRVDRAAARLDAISDGDDSLFVTVERARLDLAIGDLDGFRARVAALPPVREMTAPPLVQALSLLHGVRALLGGELGEALRLLSEGGAEAEAWRELAAVAAGAPSPGPVSEDLWGIAAAAAAARARRRRVDDSTAAESDGRVTVQNALGAAVLRELGLGAGVADSARLAAAVRQLDAHGMTGWARRLWWEGERVEGLLGSLTGIVRRARGAGIDAEVIEGALAPLGISGLVLSATHGGRVLFRVGHGAPGEPVVRGGLTLAPLGPAPVSKAGWSLLFDVLESTAPHAVETADADDGSGVRLDGVSPATADLRREIVRTAAARFAVLVEGETGSGKDVAAREIHRLSGRAGDFVAVNIAAVPANLLESELFGSLKGAFTGADRARLGLVRSADRGTLFLDEVGDLDSALQVKLLRFLESGEVRPVGSDRSLEVDVRVVCATHRNLERRVRQGRFREDLFYRIAVARIRVPALRERPEDIPVLRSIFEQDAVDRHGLPASAWSGAAERALLDHDWPGNLRELRHTVEVAMARAGSGVVRPEHLPLTAGRTIATGTWESSLAEFKQRLLTEMLNRHRGNRSRTARELGISRQALLYQIKKLGLEDL